MALERGDLIRHFAVTTIDGRLFDYDDTRQRRNLLLVALPGLPLSDSAQEYVSKMTSRDDALAEYEARSVVTTEPVAGVVAIAHECPECQGEAR
jgi:hypothetical protein